MSNPKELKLSSNKVLTGVCGGIAEYLEVDPTVVRIVYVFISIFMAGFGGLLAYLILWIILKNK